MKKWTIVIEITDSMAAGEEYEQREIKESVNEALQNQSDAYGCSFDIMEIIEAPYGPQHKDGVFIAEVGPRGHLYKRQP